MTDQEAKTPESRLAPDWAKKFRADYRTYSKGWFIALVLLVPAGLVIGAVVSGRYAWQEGLASGVFFAVILLILMLNMFKKMDKSWTGRLVAKSTKDILGPRRGGLRRKRSLVKTVYRLEVRTDAGGTEVIDVHPEAFRLLKEGDEMVKYRGLPFPDRILRPGETKRICVACGRPFDIAAPECPACRFKSPFMQEP